MLPALEYDVTQLNTLIEATLDSAWGYHDAAEAAVNPSFVLLFRKRAVERHEAARSLRAEVMRLGGVPTETGTTMGAAQRWFANLKHSVAGGDTALVASVESGEDHVKAAYESVLSDREVSEPVRLVVATAYAAIKADHDQMSALKHDRQARKAS